MARSGVWDLQGVRDKYLQGKWFYTYTLWSWGYNDFGKGGHNDQVNRSSPTQIGASTDYAGPSQHFDVSDEENYSHFVKSDGTLWVMGENNNAGGMGLNNRLEERSSPTQVGTNTNWKNVSDGDFFTLATKTDGTLWSWGQNTYGQCGYNTGGEPTQKSSPTQVGTDTTWDHVSAGGVRGVAIKYDGTLWSWGGGGNGRGGWNNTTNKSSPTQLPGGSDWTSAVAGSNTSFGINDGTLYGWGENFWGLLGQNQNSGPAAKSTPKAIPGSWSTAKGSHPIFVGQDSAGAIKADGTLWMCGANDHGQLGQSNKTNQSSPVQVGTDTDWKSLSNGAYSCSSVHAIKTTADLWSWGKNDYGQLGHNNRTEYSSPKQVGTDTDWYMIMGSRHSTIASKQVPLPS